MTTSFFLGIIRSNFYTHWVHSLWGIACMCYLWYVQFADTFFWDVMMHMQTQLCTAVTQDAATAGDSGDAHVVEITMESHAPPTLVTDSDRKRAELDATTVHHASKCQFDLEQKLSSGMCGTCASLVALEFLCDTIPSADSLTAWLGTSFACFVNGLVLPLLAL